jgi:hypothetical protein
LQVTGEPSVLYSSSNAITQVSASEDGEWVTYAASYPGESLYVMRRDGSARRRIVATPHRNRGPEFVPGGDWLIFYSNRSDTYQIWAIRRDGSGLKQLSGNPKQDISVPGTTLDGRIFSSYDVPENMLDDLKHRLDLDRRCYAFFHPRMPDEPLIFVEIALAKGLPANVQELLDAQAPIGEIRAADTAVFYSISNAQKGLRGISLGNLLLKRVIADLQKDLPWLKTFATFSPIPGFRRWFAAQAGAIEETAREPMLKLCARYLLREKANGLPLDPVAQFHLHNGASVDRIFWAADASERGLAQSCGMMVSYRYELAEVDRNHEEYLASGQVAAARRVLRLL